MNFTVLGTLKKTLSPASLLKLRGEERVLDAVLRSSFLNLMARGLGYLKSLAIAILLGFGAGTDSFFMALSLVGLFLIFADVFDSIGVPQLVRARQESEEAYRRLAGLLLTFTTFLSVTLTLLALLLHPLLMKVPSGFSKEALEATRISFLLLIPYLSLNFFFHHFGAVLRSRRRFTPYFLAEFIVSAVNLSVVVYGLLSFRSFEVLAFSLSVSQFFATLFIVYAGRESLHFAFHVDNTTKKILRHFFQLSLLYGVFHLYVLVDRAFASYLGEKAVSALAYGLILAGALKSILKFENIAITSLSETGGSLEKLNFYAKKLLYITLPTTLFLFVFSELVVKLLLGYGAFSRLDISLTAEALRWYSLSLFFMFLWPLLYRVFQIRERLLEVGIVAVLGVVLNGVLNYLFVFVMNFGIVGICLGTLGAYAFLCVVGYILIRRNTYASMSSM